MAEDRILIRVEPDTGDFQRELTSDLSRVSVTPVEVPVEADTSRAKVTIQKFQSSEAADAIEKPVDVDTTRARNILRTFAAQASVPIQKLVDLDTTRARASLASLGTVGTKALNGIGAASKGAGVAALLALGSAALAGRDELIDMNKTNLQTAQILKQTGLGARLTAKDIDKLNSELLKKSGIDDQAIQRGGNFLLTQEAIRKSVSKTPEFFKKAQTAAVDLASSPAFSGNMASAARVLGKALSDPEKGITALRKAGVIFTDEEKAKIKTIVESGKVMNAQNLVLAKVNKNLGGLGAARGKSVEGQMERIGETIAGVGASLLSFLVPAVTKLGGLLGALKPLGRVISVIGESFSNAFSGVGNGVDIVDLISTKVKQFAKLVEDNQWVVDAFAKTFADLAKQAGPTLLMLFKQLAPVLKMLAVAVGLVVLGFAKFLTAYLKVVNGLLSLIPTLTQVGNTLGQWINNVIVFFQNMVTQVIAGLNSFVAYIQALPAQIMAGLSAFGAMVSTFFRAAWNKVVLVTKTIITAYVGFIRSIPGRIIAGLMVLGQALWNLATNAFNRFRTATVNIVTAYIAFVRSIPGRIVSALGAVGGLLYDKGAAVFEGFFDGLKSVWERIKGWLSGIGKKIKNLKGPIEVDRVLLVDEGKAIMEGFHQGLESKWDGVEGWLSKRGGFIKGMLSQVGLGQVEKDIGKLLAGETTVDHVLGTIDKQSMNGLHPSSGLADTQAQAGVLHRILGIVATTFKDGHSKFVAGTNRISQHFLGLAADFGNATAGNSNANLDRAAEWMSKLVGKVFSQIIWRNAFWVGGRKGPSGAISGHLDHLHAGWLARRNGGGVSRTSRYMVGEDGPEAFIPNTSGFILNNQRLSRMLNVDRRLATLETGGTAAGTAAQVHQQVTINMPSNNAADAQGYAMMTANRLLPMLRANANALAGGVA